MTGNDLRVKDHVFHAHLGWSLPSWVDLIAFFIFLLIFRKMLRQGYVILSYVLSTKFKVLMTFGKRMTGNDLRVKDHCINLIRGSHSVKDLGSNMLAIRSW